MKVTEDIINYLIVKDSSFKYLYKRYGLIEFKNSSNIFSSLVFHIVGQMLSNKVANRIFKKLEIIVGEINPINIFSASSDEMHKIGISNKKISYIKNLAKILLDGTKDLSLLSSMSEKDVIDYLITIPGIGIWTIEMVALFNLCLPNIFSYKDVALKRGILKTHPNYKTLSKNRFERLRKKYSPYCSYASLYFYRANDDVFFDFEEIKNAYL